MVLKATVLALLCVTPAALVACTNPLGLAPRESAFQAQMVLETATGLRVVNTVIVEAR